ncbi:Hypothetical predicted protein [Pelobates cultripes]|uniref:Uncharacterized protein n=1 Tax=Pelobates cultripes TaxID=61616 RepID=A0AAD1RFY9_PELCU|nr:Hypothetical predicted protein [Pelobates cultripes]
MAEEVSNAIQAYLTQEATATRDNQTVSPFRLVTINRSRGEDLRTQCNGLKLEVKRRDANLLILQRDQDYLRGEIQSTEVAHSKDKQELVNDVVQFKKMKELTDLQISQKEMDILKTKQELEIELSNLANSEQRVRSLQSQIKQRSEQQKSMENELSKKRMSLLKLNSDKDEMEQKLLKRTETMQNEITLDLRNEMSLLLQQIREKDLQSEQDRVLRNKMMADNALLTSERNDLNNKLLELNKQLEIHRGLKEENNSYDSSSIAQLLSVKDREEHLSNEVKRYQELLQLEKIQFKDTMEQIYILQSGKKLQDLSVATIGSRIAELQALLAKEHQLNTELRRDKGLLVDHASNLQTQMLNKDAELRHISSRIEDLDSRMSFVKTDQALHRSLQSERWKEISSIADSITKLNWPLDGPSPSFEKL